ncbi:MAG TPA: SRPBCC family protein [Actinomycetota bacterium]|nr:SRPBCC family protein [Actinomycetota bacterium]
MSKIEESVDVQVPVRTAYNQWTQFEDFPQFMEGVKEVKQITDTRLRWRAEIAGVEREWEADITEQRPDERIAWQSLDGPRHAGVVTFHRLEDGVTRVMLQLEWEPGDAVEKIADWTGFVTQRVKDDLRRFTEFIESRGQETGAWRGEVDQDPTR